MTVQSAKQTGPLKEDFTILKKKYPIENTQVMYVCKSRNVSTIIYLLLF